MSSFLNVLDQTTINWWAWQNAKQRKPCQECGKSHERWHHATCFGKNICHDCYLKLKPCVQCYGGDLGYGIGPFTDLGHVSGIGMTAPISGGGNGR